MTYGLHLQVMQLLTRRILGIVVIRAVIGVTIRVTILLGIVTIWVTSLSYRGRLRPQLCKPPNLRVPLTLSNAPERHRDGDGDE